MAKFDKVAVLEKIGSTGMVPVFYSKDVEVAKNYLTEQELDALNKIVTAYLDIAEVHALNKEPMYIKDFIESIGVLEHITDKHIK